MTGCKNLIEPALRDAFADSISISADQNDCVVTFPFTRPDGDPIRMWVVEQGDSYIVTDEGETYGMLYLSGIDVESKSRERRIKAIKRRFGLDSAMFEVSKKADPDELGQTLLEVYEAIHHIASLEHSRRPYPQDDFRTVVSNYLNENIRFDYRTNVTVDGYAEPQTLDFEFVGLTKPTFMQAIRAGDGSELHRKSEETAYRFYQVRRVKEDGRFLSLIDDDKGVYTESQMKPLIADSDEVIRWTDREHLNQTLLA